METNKLDHKRCWNAVLKRDKAVDGQFFVGVLTTGIFCRPSCPSRRPLERNVRFYATPEAAERDGLRPCLRCRPLLADAPDRNGERIKELCQYIQKETRDGATLTLQRLSEHAGVSPFHLQRTFKAAVGLTPKQYVESCRVQALKRELREQPSVTGAIYSSGFGSGSRVYERSDKWLGMTPGSYRNGGRGEQISYATQNTPVGLMLVAATDRGVCFVEFGESPWELISSLREEYPSAVIEPAPESSAQLDAWVNALSSYLEGETASVDIPVDVRGTAFQRKVWDFLRSIPRGENRTYKQVATALGIPKASRAVGSACGANPVSVVIPCHRVLRGDGHLGGYRWGLERKTKLIALEKRMPERKSQTAMAAGIASDRL